MHAHIHLLRSSPSSPKSPGKSADLEWGERNGTFRGAWCVPRVPGLRSVKNLQGASFCPPQKGAKSKASGWHPGWHNWFLFDFPTAWTCSLFIPTHSLRWDGADSGFQPPGEVVAASEQSIPQLTTLPQVAMFSLLLDSSLVYWLSSFLVGGCNKKRKHVCFATIPRVEKICRGNPLDF